MALPKNLKNLLHHRTIIWLALTAYAIAIAVMCFTPQPKLFDSIHTPNIIMWGRLRLLLIPFNTIVSMTKTVSLFELFWFTLQNVMNMLLLFPLVFLLHFLTDKWHGYRKSFVLGLFISLTIEVTQLLLDLAIDANRVFEIDDIWTNALGALIAYFVYRYVKMKFVR